MGKFICVFGDSISWGAYDLENGGWVTRLWLDLEQKTLDHNNMIYNLSIPGGTTNTILERFEKEAQIRDANYLIFQSVANDSTYEHNPEECLVSINKYKQNIEEIIRRAKEITNNIIFFGFKNCDESKTMPVSWGNFYYTNENINKYLVIMKEVCVKNNVLFLDLASLNDEDFYDGLHPNAIGHEKIFNQVKDFLVKHNWI